MDWPAFSENPRSRTGSSVFERRNCGESGFFWFITMKGDPMKTWRRFFLLCFFFSAPGANPQNINLPSRMITKGMQNPAIVRTGCPKDLSFGDTIADHSKLEKSFSMGFFGNSLQNGHPMDIGLIESEPRQKPPVTVGKIIGESIFGALGSILGGVVGIRLGLLVNDQQKGSEDPYYPAAHVGYIFGSVLGNSGFVYLLGSDARTQGSFSATFVGSLIASLPLFLFVDSWLFGLYAVTLGVVLQDIGSIVGFNASRRYKSTCEYQTSLITYQKGHLRFSIPGISIDTDPFHEHALIRTLDLLEIRM
jgi:hypothetical protein